MNKKPSIYLLDAIEKEKVQAYLKGIREGERRERRKMEIAQSGNKYEESAEDRALSRFINQGH